MFFLLGEKLVRKEAGTRIQPCATCQSEQTFTRIIERNYFTLFFLRTFPLDILADYQECSGCGHSFALDKPEQASYIIALEWVMAYLMLGFGPNESKARAREIFKALSQAEWQEDRIRYHMADLDQGTDLFETLKKISRSLNIKGKIPIIEAAYLLTQSLSEMQYEDKLRVNLIGNAIGISLESVNQITRHLQQPH